MTRRPYTPAATTYVACPACDAREVGEGAAPEGEVAVGLDWEPEDRSYGADADGRRGVYVAGYWYAAEVAETCSEGCTLTPEQYADAERRAAREARDYRGDEW